MKTCGCKPVCCTGPRGPMGPTGATGPEGPQGEPGSPPGEPEGSVQFNDGGVFGGSENFIWDDTTQLLTLLGTLNSLYIDAVPSSVSPGNTALGFDVLRNCERAVMDFSLGNPPVVISFLTSGGENTGVGHEAFRELTWGSDNTAVGSRSCRDQTYAYYNSALGHYALGFNITGWKNVAVGAFALKGVQGVTVCDQNTALGFESMFSVEDAQLNVAVGHRSLYATLAGLKNTGVGADALGQSTGDGNTTLGASAGYELTTGDDNIIIGLESGQGLTTGSGNVIIGAHTAGLSAGLTDNIIFASGAGVTRLQFNGTDSWQFPATVTNIKPLYDGSAVNSTLNISMALTGSTAEGAIHHMETVVAGGNNDLYPGAGGTVHLYGSNGTGYVGVSGTGSPTLHHVGANGSAYNRVISMQLLSGLSGASVVTSGLIPAGANLLGIATRVTTTITGATSFDIGDGSDQDRFGNDIALTSGTTTGNADATADPTGWASGAREVTLTANGSNFLTGAVRVVAYYETLTGPTS